MATKKDSSTAMKIRVATGTDAEGKSQKQCLPRQRQGRLH